MEKKCSCRNYVNVDILSSISGRIRLRVGKNPIDSKSLLNDLKNEKVIEKGIFNSATHTFLLEYTQIDDNTLHNLLLRFCGLYSRDIDVSNVKLNYKLSKRNQLGYSALLSLGFIVLDLGTNFIGNGMNLTRYKSFIRWCALGTTIGAIFEHGYKELNENGAFDPEVMSIMYLVNSLHKETTECVAVGTNDTIATSSSVVAGKYSPIIAWLLTFGRHIITKEDKSIVISSVVRDGQIKVIEESNKTFFVNKFLGSCLDVYQNVSVKKSFLR